MSDRNAPRRLDIEGAEFSVIPRLLVSGVLCRVDFMLVEWHLHRVVRSKLMDGFALRHMLLTASYDRAAQNHLKWWTTTTTLKTISGSMCPA